MFYFFDNEKSSLHRKLFGICDISVFEFLIKSDFSLFIVLPNHAQNINSFVYSIMIHSIAHTPPILTAQSPRRAFLKIVSRIICGKRLGNVILLKRIYSNFDVVTLKVRFKDFLTINKHCNFTWRDGAILALAATS